MKLCAYVLQDAAFFDFVNNEELPVPFFPMQTSLYVLKIN